MTHTGVLPADSTGVGRWQWALALPLGVLVGVAFAADLQPLAGAVAALAVLGISHVVPLRYLVYALIPLLVIHPDLQPVLVQAGPVQVRPADVLLLAAAYRLVLAPERPGQLAIATGARSTLGAMLLFLLVLGASMLRLPFTYPVVVPVALVSWIKFLEFALIVPLVVAAFPGTAELRQAMRVLAGMGVVAVLLIVANTGTADILSARYGGIIGLNPLGLLSGLLALFALAQLRRRGVRATPVFLLLLGMAGLALSKSISGMIALALAAVVLFLLQRRQGAIGMRVILAAAVSVPLLAGVLFVASLLRGGGTLSINEIGSIYQRQMFALSGLLVFLQNPLMGVGWQASGLASASPAVVSRLLFWFPYLPPDQLPSVGASGVHNVYIQVLAETGLIGMLALGWFALRLAKLDRALLRGARQHDAGALELAAVCVAAQLLIAVWLNTNGLFAGQLDTGLFWFFLGCTLVLHRQLTGSERAQESAGARA